MSRLSGKQKLFYGFGGVASAAYQAMVMSYLTFFYTDVFGISAAAVGTLMLVSRLWDGINDPVMGIIVDKTGSRWGRFRPYMLFVPPFLGLSFILLFSTPDFGPRGKLAWAYVSYMLYVALYTMYDIASCSLAPALSDQRDEKKSLITVFRLIASIGGILAVFTIPAVGALGKGNDKAGFRYYAAIIAAVCVTASLLSFFNTKEKHRVSPGPRLSLSSHLRILTGSRPLMTFLLFIILSGTAANLQAGLNIHYMMQVVRNPGMIPILALLGLLIFIIAAVLAAPVSKKFSPKQLLLAASASGIVVLVLKYFFAAESIAVLTVITCISGFIGGLSVVLVYTTTSDIIDYIEYRHGRRTEGFTFSLIIFSQKFAMALGGALSGFLLAAVGYNAELTEQPASTLRGINFGINIIPIAIMLLSTAALLFYNLSETKMTEIVKVIESRREADEVHS